MPDPGEAAHLLEYLEEMGLCRATGHGVVPLADQDVDCWIRTRGFPLQPWECTAIIDLSRAYCCMLRKAERIDCPRPGHAEDEENNKKQGIKAALRSQRVGK